jgi:hypothetical protein
LSISGANSGGANNPPEPKNALAKTLTDAGISVSMSSQDLISIKVAQHESAITSEIAALNRRLTDKNKEVSALQSKIDGEVREFEAPSNVRSAAQGLAASLSFFYENAKFSATYSNELREASDTGVIIRNTAKVSSNYASTGGTHYLNTECPATQTILSLLIDRNNAMQEAATLTSEIAQKRRDLSQIPALERQAKAALVSTMLSETEAGQRLLSAVTGAKALPAT